MLYVWYFNVVNIGSNLKTTSLNSLKIIKKSPITEYSVIALVHDLYMLPMCLLYITLLEDLKHGQRLCRV